MPLIKFKIKSTKKLLWRNENNEGEYIFKFKEENAQWKGKNHFKLFEGEYSKGTGRRLTFI